MKKISVLLVWLTILACSTAHKQKSVILGRVLSKASNKLTINLPIDGKFFAGNIQEIRSDLQGNYSFVVPENLSGIAYLSNHFTSAYLFANEQDSCNVDFRDGQVIYDAQSQYLFDLMHKLALFTPTRSMVEPQKNPDLPTKKQYYTNLLEQGKQLLQSSYDQQKISQIAYHKLKHLFELKVADLQTADYFFTYRLFYEQTPEKNTEFVELYLKDWEQIYQNIFQNPEFSAYQEQTAFISRYKMFQDIKQTGALQFGLTQPYFISEINFIRTRLPNNLVEFAWANAMHEGLMQENFEKEWIDNFEEFKRQFPKSKLTEMLFPLIQKVKKFHQKDESFKVSFVENYQQINTLEELFSKYKGKVLYIDIWATWCVPCRKELQYSKENHHLLQQMGVVPIYVSIDQDTAHQQWQTIVQNLKLEGEHLRANEMLKQELSGFVTSIPHYMIIGKDGQIKEKKAKRPSDKNELFDQLKNYF